jgi:hypothetical protein
MRFSKGFQGYFPGHCFKLGLGFFNLLLEQPDLF